MDTAGSNVGGFHTSGAAYDAFMGRYSRPLAIEFADVAGVRSGQRALDVGCGPGALTRVFVERLGAASVAACDPSPSFVEECAREFPDADVRSAPAESLPFDDDRFDVAAAQLVLHFVGRPEVAAVEMQRVVRPGGTVAACVWDFDGGMEMLRRFWDAALVLDPAAPDQSRTARFGRAGEITDLFGGAGLLNASECTISVTVTYQDFDELWNGFLLGVGSAGTYCASLPPEHRDELRGHLLAGLGSVAGPFELSAMARAAVATVPG